MTALSELGGLTVLEWIDLTTLAVARNGSIIFSTRAIADMIGWTPDMVRVLEYRQIFDSGPDGTCPLAIIRAHAHLVVELIHLDGSIVRAKVGQALVLGDDEVAIATFGDLSDDAWFAEA